LVLIIIHVCAVLIYRVLGQKLIGPMITGRGELKPGTAPMRPGKWWAAVICLVVAIGTARWVLAGAPPFGP
jgi:hypothetical protein